MEDLYGLIGKNTYEINNFFKKWLEHPENVRLNVIRSLRSGGSLSAKYKTTFFQEDAFRCPFNGFDVVKPCGLTSCAFHLKTKNADPQHAQTILNCKNCLICCVDMAKNNRLSAGETAAALGSPLSEINLLSASAIVKIKKTKIKEHIEKHQIPRYKRIPGHCVSCEIHIQDEIDMNLWPELIIEPNKFGWCSAACRDKKPKWQFYIEKEFECEYLRALAIGVFVFKTFESLHNIFNINKDVIMSLRENIQESLDEIKKYFIGME